jgi:23S rRNA-/tRNA-specific pseudouridylate synthase
VPRILHDSGGLIAVDKPPGMETAGRTVDDESGLQAQLARSIRARVWAVHQLDKDTSGVNLFVRKRSLVAVWQEQLARGRKVYLAICHGRIAAQRIDASLAYDPEQRRWRVSPQGKVAASVVSVLAQTDAASKIEIELLTGRTHQARVHLAHVGHPLVGERRYREPPCTLHPRHALHCARIELGDRTISSPLPDDLRALAARLRLG